MDDDDMAWEETATRTLGEPWGPDVPVDVLMEMSNAADYGGMLVTVIQWGDDCLRWSRGEGEEWRCR